MLSLMLGAAFAMSACGWAPPAGRILDGRALLDAETFWDNKDWDWYIANIPFLDCPDEGIKTTYYYRWELLTKHLTYGSPDTGWVFTEFLDRPFWSGRYGAIACPAGHQIAEARWLRSPRIARDYVRYWVNTPGAQPRNYSNWLADATWGLHLVHPARRFLGAESAAAADDVPVAGRHEGRRDPQLAGEGEEGRLRLDGMPHLHLGHDGA